jgi:transcriptional regulator with XRE-family HTH domain
MPVQPSRSRSRASTAAAALPDRERVGAHLRVIRKGQGLTLKTLSARSGVALSTLSKIELGQISVSYEKLAAVARALDVDIAALFDPRAGATLEAGHRPVTVVRSTLAAAPRYDAENYDYRMLATDFPGRRMTPLHGIVVARQLAQFPDYIRHPGQ